MNLIGFCVIIPGDGRLKWVIVPSLSKLIKFDHEVLQVLIIQNLLRQ